MSAKVIIWGRLGDGRARRARSPPPLKSDSCNLLSYTWRTPLQPLRSFPFGSIPTSERSLRRQIRRRPFPRGVDHAQDGDAFAAGDQPPDAQAAERSGAPPNRRRDAVWNQRLNNIGGRIHAAVRRGTRISRRPALRIAMPPAKRIRRAPCAANRSCVRSWRDADRMAGLESPIGRKILSRRRREDV